MLFCGGAEKAAHALLSLSCMSGRAEGAKELPSVEIILKKGRRSEHPLFTLWRYKRRRGPFRSFVICSRKVDKRATRRNTLKRRIREILQKEYTRFYTASDVIVRIKPAGNGKSTKEFREAINHVLYLP
jgi:ribonuclease P protein component